ncbi:hypothetical protein QQS21_005854 [Conoideocrella luteorostrata]|uniref:Phospholipase/carboxylesterase/thioesterase domain-containing protein n=1 Tax=Conoideocrella luteorostrata TaxID=1105319 RepID=A0AAJ0CR49_9HYPO|nr:hypothetical protein QQS21_005854 [Conoideocrella luteorostrata]
MARLKPTIDQAGDRIPLLNTPVFLGHGVDDAIVDIELGRQAARVLNDVGLTVTSVEYSGAELDGHWFKEPEEMNDIAKFLEKSASGRS